MSQMKDLKILLSLKKYDRNVYKKIIYNNKMNTFSKENIKYLIFGIYKKNNLTPNDKNKIKYVFDYHTNNKIDILKKSMKVDFMSLGEIHKRGIVMNWYDMYQINYNIKKKMLNFLLYLRGFEYLKDEQIRNILKNNYFLNVLCWNETKFRQYFKQK